MKLADWRLAPGEGDVGEISADEESEGHVGAGEIDSGEIVLLKSRGLIEEVEGEALGVGEVGGVDVGMAGELWRR